MYAIIKIVLGNFEIKNLIFSSFENFVRQPISFLKGKMINISHIQTDLTDEKAIKIDTSNKNIQINVINNQKVYTLLSCAMYKKKMREKELNAKNKESKIFNQLT